MKVHKHHALCPDQQKAYHAITSCRTATMGGHVQKCDHCNETAISYNSCRNRNYNKCKYTKQLVWVNKLKSSLPGCRYFHVVLQSPLTSTRCFTSIKKICYKLLFKASAQAIQKAGANASFLGAQTAAVSVLHTWGQALTYHPHIHMLVPARGLSGDGIEWVNASQKFFLPVKVLSSIFRGVLWSLLQDQINANNIKIPGDYMHVQDLKKVLYSKNWNVYVKKPLAGPESVVQYLVRYTHRVAIDNSRLVSLQEGKVTFKWKDYRKKLNKELLTLDVDEFIGRFMRHILPSGFYKIRYYGWLAATNKSKKNQCILLIGKTPPVALLQNLKARQVIKIVSGNDPNLCHKCKKGMLIPKTILDPV